MRILVFFALLYTAYAIPLIPGDNSHYIEGESRYIWVPDGKGNPILVDLHEPIVDIAFDSPANRNGAKNAYYLYTRLNPTTPESLRNGDLDSVWNSNYDPNKPLKVIVHGWRNDVNSDVNVHVRDAFLAQADVNVIVVDWNHLAGNLNYLSSARGAPEIGNYVGQFLDWLISSAGGSWDRIHLVGHSLGAHIVGNAGRFLDGKPARITGLDPAGPTWGKNSNALRSGDGQYVEAIHTDGGSLGIFDKIADADFYPNGGRNPQPGCWISTCSHSRAYQLFAASVQYNHLVGTACDSTKDAEKGRCSGDDLHLGNMDLNKNGHGIFYVSTGRSWPF